MVAVTTKLRGNQNFNIIPTKSKSLRELFSVFFQNTGFGTFRQKSLIGFFFLKGRFI